MKAFMTPRKTLLAAMLCAASLGHAADKPVVYRGATLIDGTSAAPRQDMAIIVEGERIKAIVPAAQADTSNATVHDMRGMYVVPGLIDSHVHYATSPDRPYAEA